MPTTFQMRELGRDYELGSERLVDANNIQPVVAFGQSIAYRLFAARTYVVMPSTMGEEDQSRLEALCLLFGVGFVLFDPATNDPRFESLLSFVQVQLRIRKLEL